MTYAFRRRGREGGGAPQEVVFINVLLLFPNVFHHLLSRFSSLRRSAAAFSKRTCCDQMAVSGPVMGVAAFFLLSSLAIAAQATSCSKPLGGNNMNLREEFIGNNTFQDGSKVSFSCAKGYTPSKGAPTITCTDGSWSDLTLECEPKSCGAFPEVSNGNVDYSGGNVFGGKAVITCNQGYKLVGKREVRCVEQGWENRPPTCEVVKCVDPGDIANGVFSPKKEDYSFSEVVTYKCEGDFMLNGSKKLICSENGKFHPDLPKCIKVECKDPEIENAEYVQGSRPPHKHKDSVTYKCKPGYKMIGDSTVTCGINSQWSPRIPKCIEVECKDPEIENAEFVEGSSRPPHKYKATVTYKCKPGYKMIGDSTVTCDLNSQWSPRIPECSKSDKKKVDEKPGSSGNSVIGGVIGGLIVSVTVLWLQHF
ncbi:membrane cofactor protein isoform X3 [Kryptolebias marmoratus]|uniref:membrane cofactor protein isoform X3 n=1 Tax=Kryptolebias marmoratus TaxID=37003 RepID=UPI0018ACA653|nr:membrane cofactor protein isoform X3 [Kryptolebias marmoratus]